MMGKKAAKCVAVYLSLSAVLTAFLLGAAVANAVADRLTSLLRWAQAAGLLVHAAVLLTILVLFLGLIVVLIDQTMDTVRRWLVLAGIDEGDWWMVRLRAWLAEQLRG